MLPFILKSNSKNARAFYLNQSHVNFQVTLQRILANAVPGLERMDLPSCTPKNDFLVDTCTQKIIYCFKAWLTCYKHYFVSCHFNWHAKQKLIYCRGGVIEW